MFDFEVVHRPVSHHQAPDEKSRLLKETMNEEEMPIDDVVTSIDVNAGTKTSVIIAEH